MIGLAILVVVVVLILALARRPHGAPPPRKEVAAAPSTLDRAVAAGILTRAQADAVLALVPPPEPPRPPRRVSVTAEVLGYLGGVLAMVGVATLVGEFWDELATWSRLMIMGAVAAGFGVGGALVREDVDPALWRLRGFLWLLSSGALAFFTGMLGADVFEWFPQAVAMTVGLAVAAQSALLWRREDRPAQHVTCFGGLVAATAAAGAWVDGPAAAGLAIAALGAAWGWSGWRRLLPPAFVATTLGAAVVLVGMGVTGGSWQDAGPLLGLASAFALMALGSRVRDFALTALGVIGTFVYLPMVATQFFADTVGVPVVLLLTGAALLVVAVVLLRREGPMSGSPPHPA